MKKRMAIVAVASCAIEADGEVDDQEVAVVIKNLSAHPLFKDSDHTEESIIAIMDLSTPRPLCHRITYDILE